MKKKVIINLMALFFIVFSNIDENQGISTGKQYLVDDININIISFQNSKKMICEYRIDKYNNLILINLDNREVKLHKIDNEIYSLNYTIYRRLDDEIYNFWSDKNIELKKDGLYINREFYLSDNKSEKIYLIEYSSKGKRIKIPIVLKSDIIIGDETEKNKIKVFSQEKKLKDTRYLNLFDFINYLNKIEKCFI